MANYEISRTNQSVNNGKIVRSFGNAEGGEMSLIQVSADTANLFVDGMLVGTLQVEVNCITNFPNGERPSNVRIEVTARDRFIADKDDNVVLQTKLASGGNCGF